MSVITRSYADRMRDGERKDALLDGAMIAFRQLDITKYLNSSIEEALLQIEKYAHVGEKPDKKRLKELSHELLKLYLTTGNCQVLLAADRVFSILYEPSEKPRCACVELDLVLLSSVASTCFCGSKYATVILHRPSIHPIDLCKATMAMVRGHCCNHPEIIVTKPVELAGLATRQEQSCFAYNLIDKSDDRARNDNVTILGPVFVSEDQS